MDKVTIRTKALTKALFSLSAAGCEEVAILVVPNALRIESTVGDTPYLQHVWSVEAEKVESEVGKGEKLSEEEIKLIDKGKCPKCKKQLFQGEKEGLAYEVYCEAGHTFWIPPPPFLPEYILPVKEKPEEKEEAAAPPEEPPEEEAPPEEPEVKEEAPPAEKPKDEKAEEKE